MSEERFARTSIFQQRRYVLEPGDATRYDFSITPCHEHDGILTGVGDGAEYVTLTIYGTLYCGSYEMRVDALLHPKRHMIGYLKSHSFEKVNEYTIAAVLMAASVLVKNPLALSKAMDRMLDAPELLSV